jgi:hypothetical protein
MKLLLITLLSLLIVITTCRATKEAKTNSCDFPWQKVNSDICLFLTSITKTREHAKNLCNFYGGDLLYIENETEQELIQNYLSKLLRYRFNRKPYVWLDASDQLKESEWLWSRNNKTLEYSNWIPSHHNSGPGSKSLDCACYKPNNGFWKDCDCSLTQHFTCRKSQTTGIIDISDSGVVIDETPGMAEFHLEESVQATTEGVTLDQIKFEDTTQESVVAEKNNEIMMDLILPSSFDENLLPTTTQVPDDLRRIQDNIKARITTLRARPKVSTSIPFHTKSAAKRQQSIKNMPINIMKIKILKSDYPFSTFHCPHGFGYYLIENSGCLKYKLCENWNSEYASMSVNKCRNGGVFDITKRVCVASGQFECNDMLPKFVPEV